MLRPENTVTGTKGQYLTLQDLATRPFWHQPPSERTEKNPEVRKRLAANPDLLKQIAEDQAALGKRRFAFLASGVYAMVTETTERQITRFATEFEPERPNLKQMLPPITSQRYNDDNPEIAEDYEKARKNYPGNYFVDRTPTIVVEDLPHVTQQGVTEEHADALKRAYLDQGYIDASVAVQLMVQPTLDFGELRHFQKDLRPRNLFLLDDGTPITLDGGAVVAIEHVKQLKDLSREDIAMWLDIGPDTHGFTWENPDGSWKVHDHFPQTKTGKLKGMVTDDQLGWAAAEREAVKQDRPSWPEVAISELGMYPQQVAEIMKQAHAQWKADRERGHAEAFATTPDSYVERLLEQKAKEKTRKPGK